MRVLPILFNTEMVRAILEGRKSCSRRINKDANDYVVPDMDFYDSDAVHKYSDKEHTDKLSIAERTCPICPGDILYVRETWGHPISLNSDKQYVFRADKISESGFKNDSHIWHPSIHMPKEAARIWLKVTDVRVERLQEIASEQISREGVEVEYPHVLNGEEKRYAFSTLWNSTIKKTDLDRYGWDANPFVWVIEFERCEKPEVN